MALGEYLCILNSDDEFHPDRTKKMLDRLIKDEKAWIEHVLTLR